MKWWWRKNQLTDIEAHNTAFPQFEKFGETLTPNLRALRLAMTASDVLLSMGVSANSVVSKALDITETYCKNPVHIEIYANLLILSQLRGLDKEPLTLVRPVALRDINYRTVQSVQRLIYDIQEGKLTLEQAEAKLEAILKEPKSYPWWVVMCGRAGIAAAVSLMFTTSWHVVLVTFTIAIIVDRLLALLVKRLVPSFFRQIAAAAAVTIMAAVIALLGRQGVEFFSDMNPTLIVVGGIIMLVAGLAIVGAIQDAIEEYYVTAASRIMKVIMLTTGIVIGILIGLYAARKFGFGIAVSPDPLHPNVLSFQIIGGGLAAAAYALSTQTRSWAILWAGLLGGGSLAIMHVVTGYDISIIPASGIAAMFIGLFASLLSRRWRTPSVGIISAGIIPLVPGLALYNSLMQLINYPPGDPLFVRGLGTLFAALATALAIAAGASFGSMLGRPLNQKIAQTRNLQPFVHFMRKQLRLSGKYSQAFLSVAGVTPPVNNPTKKSQSNNPDIR